MSNETEIQDGALERLVQDVIAAEPGSWLKPPHWLKNLSIEELLAAIEKTELEVVASRCTESRSDVEIVATSYMGSTPNGSVARRSSGAATTPSTPQKRRPAPMPRRRSN
jgi:hypothetical protein